VRVQITKRADGAGILKCIRSDGTATWQKQSDRHAAHFALHDLTHFAVETTLGYQSAFFGLLAQGWDMEDVTGKGKRGLLPSEATEVERIVGLFDAERGCGTVWTTEEFNHFAATRASDVCPAHELSTEEISSIKSFRIELFKRWFALPKGESLELEFELVGFRSV
jgi:hypothetical protein